MAMGTVNNVAMSITRHRLCQQLVRARRLHRPTRRCSNAPSRASTTAKSTAPNDDLITVRLVSINDVYDLKNLPRLATFVRSLGANPDVNGGSNIIDYDSTISPSAVTLNGDFLSPSQLSAIDNGRGHVAALRASGVTHVCLGNREADLPLTVLKDRLDELAQRKRIVPLNSNVSGLGRHSHEIDIVSSKCGRVKVGLLGLLSDEPDMFRDGFRGLKVGDVKLKYRQMLEKVDMMRSANFLVPLTHQSLNADIELAQWMLEIQSQDEKKEKQPAPGIILGGHEHVKIHERVHVSDNNKPNFNSVQIVKTGQDSERAAVIDIHFNSSSKSVQDVCVHFEELDERYQPCPIVNTIINKHLSALEQLQDFVLFDTKTMLSEYFVNPSGGDPLPLSSEYTRYEQTTVGAFFSTAIKSELGVDVCIINGAPIKGAKTYDGAMSYGDLRDELPFPLKMIVIEMTSKQLREAIEFSRSNVEKGKTAVSLGEGKIERRGYLQTDFEYWKKHEGNNSGDSFDDDKLLTVALPRNLLKGFCKIKPLMDLHHELLSRNALPNDDDYIKAIDLIVRYCSKGRWTSIARKFSFNDLDLNNDGSLSNEEIRIAIKKVSGEEPSDELVDSMMGAIDEDSNGSIDENEFNNLLSTIRDQ